ncbi:MAG: GNAT family N-acetyltransferase [Alphaproteobacteria bacterium]|nr:GNAT family N-acetyltransferase [Alphaproteobacteria bacterium]
MDIRIEQDADERVLGVLFEGMRDFNKRAVPDLQSRKITVAVRDESGAVRGGAIGSLAGDSMYVEVVWNDDEARSTGLGRRIMLMLEEKARKSGACEAWLYTMSFQAKPFYEKLGYTQFAELPWLGGKHKRHFMRKKL